MHKTLSVACRCRFVLPLIAVLSLSTGCSRPEGKSEGNATQHNADRVTKEAILNPRDIFYQDLKDPKVDSRTISLAYAIELNRPGSKPRLVTNKEEFKSGDSIRLRLKSSAAYYLYIKCKQSSTGEIVSLYPPSGGEDNLLEAGQECVIPKKGMITFDDHAGTETLLLTLSRDHLEERDLHLRNEEPEGVATIASTTLTGRPEPVGSATVVGSDTAEDPFVYVCNRDGNNLRLNFDLAHASSGSSANDTPVTGKWAFLVGIDKFEKIQGASTGCTGDVKNMVAFLTKEAGFRPEHVISLTDSSATKRNIMQTLADLSPSINPGDLVILSFSTHGTDKTQSNENYIVTYDFDWNDPASTGIRMQDLSKQIKTNINSQRLVIMVDTCHSGNSRKLTRSEDDLRDLLTGKGFIIASSCLPTEEALAIEDANHEPIAGLFTTCLIDSWRKNHMLKVAFQNAGKETTVEAEKKSHPQHPMLYSNWNGSDVDVFQSTSN